MAILEIEGADDFDELGQYLAELVPPAMWAHATIEARKVLVQTIAGAIREEFGTDFEPVKLENPSEPLTEDLIEFADLDPEVYGEFDPVEGSITVAVALLETDDPTPLIGTLVHELRHEYQEAVVQELVPYPHEESVGSTEEVRRWAEASADYPDPKTDFVAYMYSSIETDARAAQNGTLVGYWKAAYYLAQEGPT